MTGKRLPSAVMFFNQRLDVIDRVVTDYLAGLIAETHETLRVGTNGPQMTCLQEALPSTILSRTTLLQGTPSAGNFFGLIESMQ